MVEEPETVKSVMVVVAKVEVPKTVKVLVTNKVSMVAVLLVVMVSVVIFLVVILSVVLMGTQVPAAVLV